MCGSGRKSEFRSNGEGAVKIGIPRLTVIDDSPEWAKFVKEVAERVNFSATALTSHRGYTGIAKTEPPDVLVLDLFMPEKDGIEIILGMEHLDDRPFIILISGKSRSFLESAVSLGQGKGLDIIGALAKPFRLSDLKAMLQKAASLVEQKKKLGNKTRAMHSTQRTKANPRNMVIDHDHTAAQDLRKSDNTVGFPATENSLRRSIAAINAQFCLMLWDTQLATLNALNIVPGRLTEAAADLIASIASTDEPSIWHEALCVNTQTLADNRAAIREIANSQQLPGHGRPATESIDRISTIVSEILAVKCMKCASNARMFASFRKLCIENDRLKENFAALLFAVNNALALAHDAAVSWSARTYPVSTDKPAEPPKQRPAVG